MAVTYISAETVHQSSADGSISITIPSDAEIVLVGAVGYTTSTTDMFNSINFDNTADQDFTTIVENRYNASYTGLCAEVLRMTSADANWPGTGAKTLYYDGTNYTEGYQILVFYAKGLDTSDPIRDTHSADAASTYTGSLTGVDADDLSIVFCYEYVNAPDINPSGSSQTVILESGSFNSAGLGCGYEAGESAMTADATAGSDMVSTSFALKVAAAGGGVTIPVVIHHLRQQGIS